jgi:hypothetical protein
MRRSPWTLPGRRAAGGLFSLTGRRRRSSAADLRRANPARPTESRAAKPAGPPSAPHFAGSADRAWDRGGIAAHPAVDPGSRRPRRVRRREGELPFRSATGRHPGLAPSPFKVNDSIGFGQEHVACARPALKGSGYALRAG